MKRKPYLSLLLALVMLGVMLLLVPQWWMLVVIALIALVTTQVIIVRRHLYRLPSGHSRMPKPQTAPLASPPGPGHAAEAGQGAGDVGGSESGAQPMVDQELFSRFRRHLELAEKGAGAGSAGDSEATLSDAALVDPAQVEDRVELSQAARRPPAERAQREKYSLSPGSAQQPSAPAAGSSAEEESGDGPDIFEDLRPAPPIAPRTKRPQRAARRTTPATAAPSAQPAPASARTGDPAGDATARCPTRAARAPISRHRRRRGRRAERCGRHRGIPWWGQPRLSGGCGHGRAPHRSTRQGACPGRGR